MSKKSDREAKEKILDSLDGKKGCGKMFEYQYQYGWVKCGEYLNNPRELCLCDVCKEEILDGLK